MHADRTLYDEMTRTLNLINSEIDKLHLLEQPSPSGDESQRRRALHALILAKSNCLNGMATIKSSSKKGTK